jgi:hypothetical protein
VYLPAHSGLENLELTHMLGCLACLLPSQLSSLIGQSFTTYRDDMAQLRQGTAMKHRAVQASACDKCLGAEWSRPTRLLGMVTGVLPEKQLQRIIY